MTEKGEKNQSIAWDLLCESLTNILLTALGFPITFDPQRVPSPKFCCEGLSSSAGSAGLT